MNNKIFLIIVISVILVIFFITIYVNNGKDEFKLDTEYKYMIDSKLKNPPTTIKAVTTYTNQYYEIDLEKNIIEVREDYVLDGKSKYKRKLINTKVLTDEETNQLAIILKQIIEEGKTVKTHWSFVIGQPEKYNSYYLISNKEKTNIIMDDDDMDKFLEIVKLELEPDDF